MSLSNRVAAEFVEHSGSCAEGAGAPCWPRPFPRWAPLIGAALAGVAYRVVAGETTTA